MAYAMALYQWHLNPTASLKRNSKQFFFYVYMRKGTIGIQTHGQRHPTPYLLTSKLLHR